jgi:aryl-alcohol dehydrogenase-like predicted oxidoreductase
MKEKHLKLPEMGVGTMMWADMPGAIATDEQAFETYQACLNHNLTLFDTAEMYGNGASEERLGRCIRKYGGHVMIADKFAPPSEIIPSSPRRKKYDPKSPEALREALDASLLRLGVDTIDLYQMHAPPKYNTIAAYMDVMADVYRKGKIQAIGVCNFSGKQIREAQEALQKHGLSLTSVMVQYSLLHLSPETDGIMQICRHEEIQLIPFAPLAEGILTGKYRNGRRVPIGYAATIYFSHLGITDKANREKSLFRRIFSRPVELDQKRLEKLFRIMDLMAAKYDRSLAQVALNWLLSCDVSRPMLCRFPALRQLHRRKAMPALWAGR